MGSCQPCCLAWRHERQRDLRMRCMRIRGPRAVLRTWVRRACLLARMRALQCMRQVQLACGRCPCDPHASAGKISMAAARRCQRPPDAAAPARAAAAAARLHAAGRMGAAAVSTQPCMVAGRRRMRPHDAQSCKRRMHAPAASCMSATASSGLSPMSRETSTWGVGAGRIQNTAKVRVRGGRRARTDAARAREALGRAPQRSCTPTHVSRAALALRGKGRPRLRKPHLERDRRVLCRYRRLRQAAQQPLAPQTREELFCLAACHDGGRRERLWSRWGVEGSDLDKARACDARKARPTVVWGI